MYAQIDKKCADELDGLVQKALGDGWQQRVSKVLKSALDDLTFDLGDYIGAELQDNLKAQIQDAARHTAENFLEALAEGSEQQVRQFLMLPNEYWKQRDRWYWRDYGREHGPIGLRRKLVELVQDRLEREVLLDQEAKIQSLHEQCQRQEAELLRWRTGELTRGELG